MEPINTSEEERASWWLFIKANPIGVDPNIVSPEVITNLPENVRKTLWDENTSSLIYLLGDENGLNEDQISDVARIIREIALGNLNSANLTEALKNKLGITDIIAQKIASKLTAELIAPNYFQISQLYEKKHATTPAPQKPSSPRPPLVGRPLESLAPKEKVDSMSDWAGEIVANKPSKNVVDLRKSSEPTPNKLPPTPPVVPHNE